MLSRPSQTILIKNHTLLARLRERNELPLELGEGFAVRRLAPQLEEGVLGDEVRGAALVLLLQASQLRRVRRSPLSPPRDLRLERAIQLGDATRARRLGLRRPRDRRDRRRKSVLQIDSASAAWTPSKSPEKSILSPGTRSSDRAFCLFLGAGLPLRSGSATDDGARSFFLGLRHDMSFTRRGEMMQQGLASS